MVLDAGPADIGDLAVDDHHLAVVEVERVLGMEPQTATAEAATPDHRDAVVGDDLDPGVTHLPVQPTAAEIDPAADRVDRHANLDAGRSGGPQRLQHLVADAPRAEGVDQDVDVVPGGGDVLEDPREVAPPVDGAAPRP